jgi:hypothetical protein
MELGIVVQPEITVGVVVTTPPPLALTLGLQGPAGADGADGTDGVNGGGIVTLTAAVAIGGQRVVTTDGSGSAIYADNGTLAHANNVVGLSLGAAAIAGSLDVQTGGAVEDPSFAFTPGAVLWLGANGMIATAPPGTGFSLVVGYAMTATKIFLNIGTPIIL